jgi:hypothetical protein
MNNEYTVTEVIEIGEAQEMILGEKLGEFGDETQVRIETSLDLDE